jgi:prophage tail gpP-like protein
MALPAETAVLTVNGRAYSGWTSILVRRVYGSSIGSEFEFTAAEPLDTAKLDFQNWKIVPGDRCTVTLAGILACSGFVFVRHPAFNAETHGLKITGRSKTADAVDSSALIDGGQYKGYTFEAIASALAQSAGVNLVVRGHSPTLTMPFPQFSIAWGETVFSAIERLARLRGLHLTDDENGNLVADVFDPNAGTAGQLIEGGNLIEAYAAIDGTNSLGSILAGSQRPGNDQVNGDAARDNSATVTNPNARAGRRSLIILEEPGSSQDCAIRANHEMSYRATDLVDCHCVVQGWQSSPGALWEVGRNYSVKSPMLDLDRVLAARQVVYTQDESGSRTAIDLCTRQALAFSIGGAVITPTALPGEPAYSSEPPAQGAIPNQPDSSN